MLKQEISSENVPTQVKDEIKAELGYDSDLVMGSDDEKRLDEMPELKREQELSERRCKRLQLIERYRLIQQ